MLCWICRDLFSSFSIALRVTQRGWEEMLTAITTTTATSLLLPSSSRRLSIPQKLSHRICRKLISSRPAMASSSPPLPPSAPPPPAALVPSSPSLPSLKRRLAAGQQLYGAFLMSFSPVVAEIIGWSGYDFAVVDMEHGPGDFFSALPVLRALASTGTPAIIRIPDNDPALAKKALDIGPAGIMIPMIETPEAARKAVAACRYPPLGIRGAAPGAVRASKFGIDQNYAKTCHEDLFIMVQVESEAAVGRIEEIAAVDGVDGIQMGPTDLSASIGCLHNPGDEKAVALLRKAEKAVIEGSSGTYLCGFTMAHDPPEALQARGYHMVSGAVDVALIRDAALADVRKFRECSRSRMFASTLAAKQD